MGVRARLALVFVLGISSYAWAEETRTLTADQEWALVQLMRAEPLEGAEARRLYDVLTAQVKQLPGYTCEVWTTKILEYGLDQMDGEQRNYTRTVDVGRPARHWGRGQYWKMEVPKGEEGSEVTIGHPDGTVYRLPADGGPVVTMTTEEFCRGAANTATCGENASESATVFSFLRTDVFERYTVAVFELFFPELDVRERVWISDQHGIVLRREMSGTPTDSHRIRIIDESLNVKIEEVPESMFQPSEISH